MKRREFTALAAASLTPLAHAQADKTLRVMVGFPPGGSIDVVARVLADKMKDELKANIVVENRAGAGGRLAADLLKSAPADGSVVMITPVVVPVLAPLVFSKLNYNPATDFAPVGHVCNFNFALSIPASLPAKTVAEFVAWLKANPQRANFGSPAAGSLPHFFGEILSREAKADMVHVPCAGGAALMTALVGGQVSAGIDVVLEALEAHRAGKVRILATSGERRSAVLPDVPTFKESGYPGIVASGWFAMYAPGPHARRLHRRDQPGPEQGPGPPRGAGPLRPARARGRRRQPGRPAGAGAGVHRPLGAGGEGHRLPRRLTGRAGA